MEGLGFRAFGFVVSRLSDSILAPFRREKALLQFQPPLLHKGVLRIQAFLILDACTHATRPPKSAYLAKRELFFAHRSTFTSGHEICFHGLIPAQNSCLGLVQFRKDRLWHPIAEFFSTASTKPLSVHVRGPLLSKNCISWFRVQGPFPAGIRNPTAGIRATSQPTLRLIKCSRLSLRTA